MYRSEYHYNKEEERKVAEDLSKKPTAKELFLKLQKMSGLFAAARERLVRE